MQFPIEIQMLINEFAKPATRPDWRKGSFINITYRSWWGQLSRLDITDFKLYLKTCREMDFDEIKHVAWTHEKMSLDDIDIIHYRKRTHPDYESDEDIGYDFDDEYY